MLVFHQNLTTLKHKVVFTLGPIMASLGRSHFSPPPPLLFSASMENGVRFNSVSVFFTLDRTAISPASTSTVYSHVCFHLSTRVGHYKQQPISLFRHSSCMTGQG